MDHEATPRLSVTPPQTAADTHPEDVQTIRLDVGESSATARPVSQTSSVEQQQPLLNVASEGQHTFSRPQGNPYDPTPVPHARSRDGHGRGRYPHLAPMIGAPLRVRSSNPTVDWIVPVEEKSNKRRTVGERLDPTIANAESERERYAMKAAWTGYALNIAIGLQVFLGALTTGLAAAVTDARQAQISTALLGGLSTIVASYLARARGSGEPELSTRRLTDLDHFLRDCRAFQIDHAHEYAAHGDRLDHRVEDLRRKLEEMLGNVTDGGDKRAAPGVAPTQAAVP